MSGQCAGRMSWMTHRVSHRWTWAEAAAKRDVGCGGKCPSCRNNLKTETTRNVSGASTTVRGISGTLGLVVFPASEKNLFSELLYTVLQSLSHQCLFIAARLAKHFTESSITLTKGGHDNLQIE